MYNHYIKELSIKTYQEELAKEYVRARGSRFHTPSFSAGVVTSLLLFIVF